MRKIDSFDFKKMLDEFNHYHKKINKIKKQYGNNTPTWTPSGTPSKGGRNNPGCRSQDGIREKEITESNNKDENPNTYKLLSSQMLNCMGSIVGNFEKL